MNGEWTQTEDMIELMDPLKAKDVFIRCANTKCSEIKPFIENLKSIPKSGLHNPFKNPERYQVSTDFVLICSQGIFFMVKLPRELFMK